MAGITSVIVNLPWAAMGDCYDAHRGCPTVGTAVVLERVPGCETGGATCRQRYARVERARYYGMGSLRECNRPCKTSPVVLVPPRQPAIMGYRCPRLKLGGLAVANSNATCRSVHDIYLMCAWGHPTSKKADSKSDDNAARVEGSAAGSRPKQPRTQPVGRAYAASLALLPPPRPLPALEKCACPSAAGLSLFVHPARPEAVPPWRAALGFEPRGILESVWSLR